RFSLGTYWSGGRGSRGSAALPRAGPDGEPAAAISERRPRRLPGKSEHNRTAASLTRAKHHRIRLRPSVLLFNLRAHPERDIATRQVGQHIPTRPDALQPLYPPAGLELREAVLPSRPSHVREQHAVPGNRRIALGPANRAGFLLAGYRHPSGVRPD